MREETRQFAIKRCEKQISKGEGRLELARRCRKFVYPCELIDWAEAWVERDIKTYGRLLDAFEKTVTTIR